MNITLVKRLTFTNHQLNLVLAICLALFYNKKLWGSLISDYQQPSFDNYFFIFSFFILLVAIFHLILTLTCIKFIHKPITIAIVLSAALATYFMNTFGIVYNKEMIQNILQTDTKEVADLINLTAFYYLVLLGIIPSMLILNSRIIYTSRWPECKKRFLICAACILVIAGNLMCFYQQYSSTFRNHREIRNLVIPSSYLYYSARYLSGAYQQRNIKLQSIADDAVLKGSWQQTSLNTTISDELAQNTQEHSIKPVEPENKKVVTIIVIGETARAMNFSLNGYPQLTNPQLQQKDIINFSNVSSCGTSTAVSVPCIFSNKSRKNFDYSFAKHSENILDVMARVGFDVLWRDNNSGCKGVCDRINQQSTKHFYTNQFCQDDDCFDEALLENLDDYLQKNNKPTVIVLHQLGSHGPAYYKRSPEAFKKFTPTCKTNELNTCDQQNIINSYNNSLLYTDHFLAKTIDYLEKSNSKYDSAMLYVSDHGESLGENNVYLHGLPYSIAPSAQTKVPMILWLSNTFKQRFQLKTNCLKKLQTAQLSHDNIFHSLLGLFGISTSEYQSDLDIFANCHESPASSLTAG